MAIESYMKTSPRSRFWIRETGKASINGHMPVEKSRNKREGRPRPPAPILSIPPMPDSSGVSSHHPATISHPLFVNCHAGELARLGASHTCAWLVSRRSLFPSRTTKHNEGDGVWRGSRKTEPPPRDKKNPCQTGESQPSVAVCRGLGTRPPSAALCLFGEPSGRGGPSLNPATRQETGRFAGDAVRGAPVMSGKFVGRQTAQLSKSRERGVQGPSPAPPKPPPQLTSPQCDPDTQVLRSSLGTESCVWIQCHALSSS